MPASGRPGESPLTTGSLSDGTSLLNLVPDEGTVKERRLRMQKLRYMIAGGLLAGALCFPAMPVSADHNEEKENPGWHKGWEKNHHGWAKGRDKKWKDNDRHDMDYRERDRYGDHY
jgi:hypothetical protein